MTTARFFICIALFAMLGGCISSVGDLFGGRPADAQFEQMDYTTPGKIAAIYAENTLDADKKYEGKWTKVRGVIDGSPTEVKDMYHKTTGYGILLSDEKKTNKTKFVMLNCTFPADPETEKVLRGLKRGQVVEVVGRFSEYKPGFLGPFLRDCAIFRVIR